MKYSWTLDELVLVLDFYVTWRSPSKDNELQFADLAELVFPHSKQSVKALIRNYQHLDPNHPHIALKRRSNHAEWMWNAFADDPKRLRKEARKIRNNRAARAERGVTL